jgi:hypothetical protein
MGTFDTQMADRLMAGYLAGVAAGLADFAIESMYVKSENLPVVAAAFMWHSMQLDDVLGVLPWV